MLFALGAIIVIAIVLWIITFFMQDRVKQLEDQFEQFSISSLQETYQLKKKINVLEEELLIDDLSVENTMTSNQLQTTPMMNKIKELHQQGYDSEDIAKQVDLNEFDVVSIIKQF